MCEQIESVKMRVLQIGLSKNIGGIETFVMSYYRRLAQMGIVFDFIDTYGDGLAFSDEIESLGGKIFTIPNYKKHPFIAKKLMLNIIRENKYECVHIHMLSAANLLPLKAALKAGSVAIVHAHNNNTHGFLRTVMHNMNVGRLRRLSEVRLSCGKEAGDWLYGKYPFRVIPNAIDAEKFSFSESNRHAIREKIGISAEDFVIGFVGRLSTQKNPFYLIDILSAVKTDSTRPVKMLVVGEGELKEKVEKYAQEKGVVDDLVFAGRQNDMAPWYSAMDCFVLPSLYEGFVIVGIEAQANGLRCFMSEQVPHEINITGTVKFLPLIKPASNWRERISDIEDFSYGRGVNGIIGTTYDITVSADTLCQVYANAINK